MHTLIEININADTLLTVVLVFVLIVFVISHKTKTRKRLHTTAHIPPESVKIVQTLNKGDVYT